MNVQTRREFLRAKIAIRKAKILAVDTETNTLRVIQTPTPLVSIQVYIPDTDTSYNFPFRQGHGEFEVAYNKTNPEGTEYWDMTWGGSTKKSIMVDHYYAMWKAENEAELGNLPIKWMEELKAVLTPDKTYLMHNARFDMHVMETEGFTRPTKVLDTMVMLSVAWNDWNKTRLWDDTKIIDDEGNVTEQDVGWVWGNRRLKWQAEYWGKQQAKSRSKSKRKAGKLLTHEATIGEQTLHYEMEKFERRLAEFIVEDLETNDDHGNIWLKGIIWKSFTKTPDKVSPNGDTWRERQIQRIQSKLSFNDKSELWVLPSHATALYGELDVVITYKLYEQLMTILEAWDDVDLFIDICAIQTELAFRMERTGFKLDAEECYKRFTEILADADRIAKPYLEIELNIGSPKQLVEHLKIKGKKPSSDNDTLTRMLDDEKLPEWKRNTIEDVLLYRKRGKEANTYLSKWYYARDDNDMVHGSFDVTGTKTGRMSSSGDAGNLQNIPDRTYDIKSVIIPPTGNLMWAIDYGQLEARLASWIAETLLQLDEEQTMTTLFNEGTDMHSYTAKMLGIRELMFSDMSDQEIADDAGLTYDVDTDDIGALVWSRIIRQTGKIMNFGLIYGGSAGMAMHQLETTYEIAEELVRGWNELFPAFLKAQEYYTQVGRKRRGTPIGTGNKYMYVSTPVPYAISNTEHTDYNEYWEGRNIKHHLYETKRAVRDKFTGEWKQTNPRMKSTEKGWNGVVQGLGGWICTMSGYKFYTEQDTTGIHPFAQIHDAFDGFADVNKLSNLQGLFDVMLDWDTSPPLTIELEASMTNWQTMREVADYPLWVDSKGHDGYKADREGNTVWQT